MVEAQIKKFCEALEVDADAHKEAEESEEKSSHCSGYLHSLKEISALLTSLGQVLEEKDDQSNRRTVVKQLVPALIAAVVPHCGKHYWTTAESRQQSRGLLAGVLHICGCGSVLELLIGELPSGHAHTSPYLPVEEQRNNKGLNEVESGQSEDVVDDSIIKMEKDFGSVESSSATSHVVEGRDSRADGKLCESNMVGFPSDSKDKDVVERHELIKVTDDSKPEQDLEIKPELENVGTVRLESPSDSSELRASNDAIPATATADLPPPPQSGLAAVSSSAAAARHGAEDSCAMVFRGGLLKATLVVLRPRLNQENWKKNPNAKHTLVWCLRRLKHPHVGPYLNSFLPPLLMLLDDHEVYHKVLGLSAVTHLIKNVDAAELRWQGRAEVIFEAVQNFLYMNDVELITALHPCLIVLLPVLEGHAPRSVTSPRKPSKTDEVFARLLNSLDFEPKIETRRAYVTALSGYIKLLGIFTTRHMKRLLPILFSCLEFPDYSGELIRRHALRTLATLVTYTWPRIPFHADEILKVLLKLISDLCPAMEEIPDKQEVLLQLPLITECLVLLARCCHHIVEQYEALWSGCQHEGLRTCLESCFKQLNEE